MSRIFWDTHLFMYLLEDYEGLSAKVIGLRERMLVRGDLLYTSTLTLGEVLVKPAEAGDRRLLESYETLLRSGAELIDFDGEAARHYALIRTDRAIRPPDAIQLACAAAAGIDLFITNDERLSSKVVTGVQFVTSLERAFL